MSKNTPDDKRLRILIFSWRDLGHPNNGGAEIVTHEHAKAWVRAGHSVTLFTSMYGGATWEEILDGVSIVRRGNELLTVQVAAFFWYQKHKNEFDLVFDHFHGIPFYTPLFVQCKKIAFIHEVAKEVWKLNALPWYISWLPSLIGPAIEKVTLAILYKKTPFITVSQSTKDDLALLGISEKNIIIIENGLTLPKSLKKYEKEAESTIMFLGAHAKDKGIQDAIDAFAKLNRLGKYQFWVVGRAAPVQIDFFKKYSEKLGLSKNINFYGYVSEVKKFELLYRAHILVNPSAHEGWGLVNLEANICGTPVVAYDVHGNRDSILHNKTGVLVEKCKPEQIAKAINSLLRDENRYTNMQKSAKQWAKQFTWEKSTSKSLKYIESIKNT